MVSPKKTTEKRASKKAVKEVCVGEKTIYLLSSMMYLIWTSLPPLLKESKKKPNSQSPSFWKYKNVLCLI